MGIPEERDERTEIIFKTTINNNFSKLMSDTMPQLREAQKILSRSNTKQTNKQKTTPQLDLSFSNYRKAKIKKKS